MYERNFIYDNCNNIFILQIEASLAFSAFRKEAYNYVKNIDIPNIKNERDRRLFEKIADIGTGALKSKQELGRVGCSNKKAHVL